MAYADEQVKIGVGRAHRGFVAKETVFGTMVEPTTNDLVLSTAQHIPEQQYDYTPDAQKRNERSRRQQIKMKLGVGKMSLECYLKPANASLTYPELTDVLEGLMGAKSQTTANGTTVAASTTTLVKGTVGDGVKWTVGQALAVDVSATSTPRYECAIVTAIATDDFTVDPPLTAAPGTGKVIYGSSNFSLANAPGSYTFWVEETDIGGDTGGVKYLLGSCIEKGTFGFSGKGEPVTFKGDISFRQMIKVGRDALNGAINNIVTSVVLQDSTKYDVGAVIKCGTEAMKVTAIDYGTHTLTVTRGYASTTPASHSDADVVLPYLPAGVELGVPVAGYLGKVRHDQGEIADVISAEVTIDQKPKWITDTKDSSELPLQFLYPEMRECSVAAKAYYSQDHQKYWRIGEQQTSLSYLIPGGDTPGKIVGIYMPNVDTNRPKLSGDAEQQIDLDGYPYATSAGNDEVRLFFI